MEKLVKFLTNFKDLKLQVKTEPSTLIITYPPTKTPLRFDTGNYFIKFFQERPIIAALSSPKFESDDYILFITDDDGNKFIITSLDFKLSDYRISDVEQREVYIGKDGKNISSLVIFRSRNLDKKSQPN